MLPNSTKTPLYTTGISPIILLSLKKHIWHASKLFFVFLIMEPGHHHRLDLQHREPTSYERPANIMIFYFMSKYGSLLDKVSLLPFFFSFFLFLAFCNIPNVVTFLLRRSLILPRGRFQLTPQVSCRVSRFSRFPLCLFYFIFSECIRLILLRHHWDLNSNPLLTNHQTRKKSPSPSFPARSCPA